MTAAEGDLQTLYRELILDHAQHPRNFGKLENATHTADGINPLCGDKLHLYLQIDAADQVSAARFEGSGCAISMASASLLTEAVENQSTATAEAYVDVVTARLTGNEQGVADRFPQLEKLRALDGVRRYPSRIKCATLAWHALGAALEQQPTPASTE